MSTQPITTSSLSSGAGVSSLGSSSPLQITGLASGLDTNSIIQALMAIDQQPITALQNQSSGLTATNTQLSSIQTALQQLSASAKALGSASLFTNTQTATSTNSTLVSASTTTGTGAVIGSYQVGVTNLASSAQRTFSFTSPTAADTVTIDGQQISLNAGASAQDLVNSVNSNSSLDVWATATDSGTVVFSNRATGDTGTGFIGVSDTTGSLTEQTALAQQGANAQYTINGVAHTSASDTVTGAIPGVTLTLNGLTTTSGTVTVKVSPPAPNSQSIQTAVQAFVTSYNQVIAQVQTQLSTQPSRSDPTVGTLFGDPDLRDLLSNMRQAMYTSGSALPNGMASMLDIGVSTGAASGSSLPSQNAIAGDLTLDPNALMQALTSNPNGFSAVLKSWSTSFSGIVDTEAQVGGTIDSRIQGDNQQISDISSRIQGMQETLNAKQTALQAQFAALEATLSQNQSTASWLASQISALPTLNSK
ncbi:MAG TPA: flagellar filament capping protein FliD [Solirubrobacteraceae bacterium]|jgi:flagellar hook-associated protein 2|nr:flagellar filament capping protein FliD [Solirubrobacteraceae bacterium]